jgi:hypothetical protein
MKRYCEQMGVECSDDEDEESNVLKEARGPVQETVSVVRQQLMQGLRMPIGTAIALVEEQSSLSLQHIEQAENSPEEAARAAAAAAKRNLADSKDELGANRRKVNQKEFKAAVAKARADEVAKAEQVARTNLQETEAEIEPLQEDFTRAKQVLEKETKLRVSLDDVAADKEAEQLKDQDKLNEDRKKLDDIQVKLTDATEKRASLESDLLVQTLKEKDLQPKLQIAKSDLDAANKGGHYSEDTVKRLRERTEDAAQYAATKEAVWEKAEAHSVGAKKAAQMAGSATEHTAVELAESRKALESAIVNKAKVKAEHKVAEEDAARTEAERLRLSTATKDAHSKATVTGTKLTRLDANLKDEVAKQKTAAENAHDAKLKAAQAEKSLLDRDKIIQQQQEDLKQKEAKEQAIDEKHSQAQKHLSSAELQLLEATSVHDLANSVEKKQSEVVAQAKVVTSELKRAYDAAKAKHHEAVQKVELLKHQFKQATTELAQLRGRTDQAASLVKAAQALRTKKDKALSVVRTDLARSEESAAQSATELQTAQQRVAMMQGLLDDALKKEEDADAAVTAVVERFAAERNKVGALLQEQQHKLGNSKNMHKQAEMAKEQASSEWHQTAKDADEAKAESQRARRHTKDTAAAAIKTRKAAIQAALEEAKATQALQAGQSKLRRVEVKRDEISASVANSDESILLNKLKNEQSALQDTVAKQTIIVDTARDASRNAALKVEDLKTVRDRVESVLQSAINTEADVRKNKVAIETLGESTLVHKQDADMANEKSRGALEAVRETVGAVGRALGLATELHNTASTNVQDSAALIANTQAASNAANAKLQQATAELTEKTSVRATAQDNKMVTQQTHSEAQSAVNDATLKQAGSRKDLAEATDAISLQKGKVTELESAVEQTKADLALAASNIADKSKVVEEARAAEELVMQQLNQISGASASVSTEVSNLGT